MAAEYSSCQETIMKRNEENGTINGGFGFEFDPSAPPPFKIAEIRAAIPTHCWVKNPWRSLSYVLRDALLVISLAAFALHLNNWLFWPFYWLAQGTMFWAIFVLGHDCGHGSFSNNPTLNSVVGHLLHSSILVPYNGWRISHRTHHQNHGNVENDESWVPLSEELYKNLNLRKKIMRFTLPFPMLAYPLYLWTRGPGKHGSHFNPKSNLFAPNERKAVITSTICWTAMLLLLFYASFAFGPLKVLTLYGLPYLGVFRTCWTAMLLLLFYASIVFGPLKVLTLYGLPYLIFVVWLDFVTYLHHHGYQQKLPWYRGKEWSYLRGGLTTVDRDYGWINNIHHDIGTHVIHHLFPQIPHYHLVEATKAAKPVLGKFYREPKQSGPFPLHLLSDLVRSISQDHYVSNTGDIVYYQTDPTLLKSSKTN